MKSLAVSKEYGLARYVAHQAYYSLVGRDYEWELMPLALDHGVGCVAWSPLGFARLTGKVRRGQGLPEMSRLRHKDATAGGPAIADEYLFRVVDALDAHGHGDRQDRAAGGDQLGARAAQRGERHHRRAQRGSTPSEPGGGRLATNIRSSRQARCRKRGCPRVSNLAPAALCRAKPAGGVKLDPTGSAVVKPRSAQNRNAAGFELCLDT